MAPLADWAAAAGDTFLARYFREHLVLVDTRRWAQILGMALVSHLLEPSPKKARWAVTRLCGGLSTKLPGWRDWLSEPRRWVREQWTAAHWRTAEDLACAQAHMTLAQYLDPVEESRDWAWAIEDRVHLGALLTLLRANGHGEKLALALDVLDNWARCELARGVPRPTSEWSRRAWLRVLDLGWHTPEEVA